MTIPFPAKLRIADDHVMVRRRLRPVLDHEPDLRVVAEAAVGIEQVRLADEAFALRADVRRGSASGRART